jgi:ABC-type bacteriocin/lantibiotic exporter with double-glycine peptidase domain
MHNIYLIKRSFIRQSSQDTCGIACLGMILNYTGKHEQVNDLNSMPVKAGGLNIVYPAEVSKWNWLTCVH